jgi:hypothetical protein
MTKIQVASVPVDPSQLPTSVVSGAGLGATSLQSFQGRTAAAAALTKADVTGTGLAASDVSAVPSSAITTAGALLNQVLAYNGSAFAPAAAAAGVSPKGVWSGATTYALGDWVSGSDSNFYVSQVASNLNNNPVGDNGTHWLSLLGTLAVLTGVQTLTAAQQAQARANIGFIPTLANVLGSPIRTNFAINPGPESGSTSYWLAAAAGGTAAVTNVTDAVLGNAAAITWSVAATSNSGGGAYARSDLPAGIPIPSGAIGGPFSVSIVACPSIAQVLAVTVQFYNASNAQVGTNQAGGAVTFTAGQYQTLVLNGMTVPAAATHAVVSVWGSGVGQTQWPIGSSLRLGHLMAEAAATVGSWFSGDSTGASWSGATGASTSSTVTFPESLSTKASINSTLNIATGTTTSLQFGSTNWDFAQLHNDAGNTQNFGPATHGGGVGGGQPGYYRAAATITIPPGMGQIRKLWFGDNNGVTWAMDIRLPQTNGQMVVNLAGIGYLGVNDQVHLAFFHDAGASLALVTGWMSLDYIGGH